MRTREEGLPFEGIHLEWDETAKSFSLSINKDRLDLKFYTSES